MSSRIVGLVVVSCAALYAAGCSGGGDSGSVGSPLAGPSANGQSIAQQSCNPFGNPPAERTTTLDPATNCFGGRQIGPWSDAEGTARHACLYEPANASSGNPLPMVVWIHPSLFTADTVGFPANILEMQGTTSLSDDPQKVGFIIVAPQGRSTTHFYPSPDDKGLGWDNWYRQFHAKGGDVVIDGVVYPQNVDAATIDHFIAEELKTGKVDTRRIYVMGWSNGSAMGILYSLTRPMIAAAAVYSSPNPFEAFNDPCPQTPVLHGPDSNRELQIANSNLPLYHLHNDCDIGGICPNGELLKHQLQPLGVDFEDVIIDTLLQPAGTCLDVCGTNPNADFNPADNPGGYSLGSVNHLRWPLNWTAAMLAFLRDHHN